jgi:hypothetical protein
VSSINLEISECYDNDREFPEYLDEVSNTKKFQTDFLAKVSMLLSIWKFSSFVPES